VLQNLAYCYWPAIAPRLASPLLPVQLGSLCRAVYWDTTGETGERQRRLIFFRVTARCGDASSATSLILPFLAKARMRGDGPPYIMIGRSIRYSEAALIQWMRSQQRLSTSE